MSLNSRFQDFLISIFESFEESNRRKTKILVAILGIVATIALWVFHLHNPSYLFNSYGEVSRLAIVIALAPPFLTVLSVAQLLSPKILSPEKFKPGLFSFHMQKERSNRRAKIMIVAVILSVMNLLSMIMLSRSIG